LFQQLYDIAETSSVHFCGYVSDHHRYDLAIIYTDQFFGKPLVVCMQSGKTAVISLEDAGNIDYLQHTFQLSDRGHAEEMAEFLQHKLHLVPLKEQY